MELCSRVDGKTILIKSDYSCRYPRRNGMAKDIDVVDLKSYLKQVSLFCVFHCIGPSENGTALSARL